MQTSLPNHSATKPQEPAHNCNERVIERSISELRQLRSAFNVLLKDPRVACLSVDCEILIDKLVGQLGEVQHARS